MARIPRVADPREQFEDGSGAVAEGEMEQSRAFNENAAKARIREFDTTGTERMPETEDYEGPEDDLRKQPIIRRPANPYDQIQEPPTEVQYKPIDSGQTLSPELLRAYKERFGDDVATIYARDQEARQAATGVTAIEEFGRRRGLETAAQTPAGVDPRDAAFAKQAMTANPEDSYFMAAARAVYASIAPYMMLSPKVANDVGKAITNDFAVDVLVGGPVKAMRNALELTQMMSDWLDKNVADLRVDGLPSPQDVLSAAIPDALERDIDDGTETVTGGIFQAITQFLIGFYAFGAPRSIAGAIVKGTGAEFAAFDGQDANLANLLAEIPALQQNAILDYLANDEDTPEIEGRLKNALTGIVAGTALEGLMIGLRAYKAANKVRELAGAETAEEAAAKITTVIDERNPEVPQATGGRNPNDLLGGGPDDLPTRETIRLKPVDLEVPAHVAAKALIEDIPRLAPPLPGNVRLWSYDTPGGTNLPSPARLGIDGGGPAKPRTQVFSETPEEARRLAESNGFPEPRELTYIDVPKSDLPAGPGWTQPPPGVATGDRNVQVQIDRMDSPPKRVADQTFRVRILGEEASDRPVGMPIVPDVETEVFINWNRISESADIKNTINEMAQTMRADIDAARRGVRTNKQTIAAAGNEDAWRLLVERRGKPMPANAEETLALRNLWASSGKKLMELAKLAANGGPAEAFAFRRMMAIHNTIQQEVIAIRTETARALQQWAIAAGSDNLMMAQIDDALRQSGGLDRTIDMARRLSAFEGQPGLEIAAEEFVRRSGMARFKDVLKEVWINSLLSGPRTHFVNAISNTAVALNAVAERAIAGRIGDVMNPVTGVKIGEAAAMLHGQQAAMRDMWTLSWRLMQIKAGMRNAVDMPSPFMTAGLNQAERPYTRAISSESFGIPPDSVLGRSANAAGAVVNTPVTLLGGSDVFFKTINYRAHLHALAFRTASEEVQRGVLAASDMKARIADIVANPDESIVAAAQEFAKVQTFTNDPGKLIDAVRKFRGRLDEWAGNNIGLPVGTWLLPFLDTPANIIQYTFDRTPLAPIGTRFRSAIAKGGPEANMALAKLALGSSVIMMAYDLALNGHLTGGGPKGSGQRGLRQTLRRGGWQPYSIRVIEGEHEDGTPIYRYYAYNRLDPIGYYVGFAADLADIVRNSNGGSQLPELNEVISGLALGIAENVSDKTYFTGVSRFMEAMANPNALSEGYFNSLAASFIPSAVKEWTRVNDPVMRHHHDMITAMQARIPYLSKGVPPRLNFFGDPISYQSGLGPVYDAVSPIYSSETSKATPIDREFVRLNYNPTHMATLSLKPDEESDSVAVPLRNMPVELNSHITTMTKTPASELLVEAMKTGARIPRSKQRRLMLLGKRTMREALDDIVTGRNPALSAEYADLDDDDKRSFLSETISAFRSAAKPITLAKHPNLIDKAREIVPMSERGTDPPF